MQRLYILLLVVIANLGCYAQHSVTGYVVDSLNNTLDNVNVLLYSSGDSSQYVNGVTTDMKGHFAFQDVKVGSYRLVFSMLGFAKQEREVKMLNKEVRVDTIRLHMAYELLEEVVVKADLMQVFGEKESRIFSPNEKKRAPSGLELMRNIPQLVLNGMSHQLQTVGGGQVLILCNGLKIEEADLMGMRPEDVIKAEYFAQPPVRYANMGVEAVLNIVVRRPKEGGGYVMANLQNGFTTGYGTDIMQGKYSVGDHDFSLRYFIDYRNLNKNRLDQSYRYTLNEDDLYQIEKQGENSDYKGEYHKVEASFARVKTDNYLFSAKAKLAINPGMENSPQRVVGLRNDVPIVNDFSTIQAKSNYMSPNLDLYFSKQFAHKQEINLNIVNTYYDTKSDKMLIQNTAGANYEAITHLNNTSYSVISEAVYTKDFGKHGLNVGARHFYKTLHENYTSNLSSSSSNQYSVQNLYPYAEMTGRLERFTYVVGLGGEQTWLQTEDAKRYFVWKPTVSLAYAVNKQSSFKLRSYIRSYVPDIALLTSNPAYIDSAFISRGNPDLKPYYALSNYLYYTFNTPSFYLQTCLFYVYTHRPFYAVFTNKGTYVEKTYTNVDQMNATGGKLYASWTPFQWLTLSPYYSIEYQQSNGPGYHYEHWFQQGNFSLSASYKDFTLNAQLFVQNASLEGSLLSKPSNSYMGDITWKKNNLSVTLACLFMNDPTEVTTCTGTPVYYRESKSWNNFNGLMYLQLVYTLPFGKKIQRALKQQLNNADNDAGLYIDNKAKQ